MVDALSPLTLGPYTLHLLSFGELWLDGGAMFGVVPRVIWEKKLPPDEKNRIRLAMNALLIETKQEKILVDTGIGTKEDERFRQMFRVTARDAGEVLASVGLQTKDIDIVINTHLHFDHAGGNTKIIDGAVVPTFPEATYLIQRREWNDASSPHERNRGSYLRDSFLPLQEHDRFEVVDGDHVVRDGIALIQTPGHTASHQSVLVRSDDEQAFYAADLFPTRFHIALPYIMGYDLYPVQTLNTKKQVLQRAADESWRLLLEHEVEFPIGRVKCSGDSYQYHPDTP